MVLKKKTWLKKALVAAVIGGAVIVGLPILQQSYISDQFEYFLSKANFELEEAGKIDMKLTEISRSIGYTGSVFVTRIESTIEGRNCIEIKTAVSHGFPQLVKGNLFSSQTTIVTDPNTTGCGVYSEDVKNPQLKEVYAKIFEGEPPVIVDAVRRVFGSYEVTARTKELDLKIGGKSFDVSIYASPITVDMSFDRDLTYFDTHYSGGKFSVSTKKNDDAKENILFGYESFEAKAEMRKDVFSAESFLWVGPASAQIYDIFASKGDNHVSVETVFFNDDSKQTGGLYSKNATSEIANVILNETAVGSFSINFGISNIKSGLIDRLSQKVSAVGRTKGALPKEEIKALEQDLKLAFSNSRVSLGPVIWSLPTEKSTAESRLNLDVSVGDLKNLVITQFKNPYDAAMSALDSSLSVEIDKTFTEPLADIIATFKQSKLPKSLRTEEDFANLQYDARIGLDGAIKNGPVDFEDAGDFVKVEVTLNSDGFRINGNDASGIIGSVW